MKLLEHAFAPRLNDNARFWCELDENCPPGLFIASHPAGVRFWIFTHREGGQRFPVAVQLDACDERPAFSFTVLSEATGLVGIWLGRARIELRREANQCTFPNRSGPVRVRGRSFVVRCTTPGGGAIALNNQEEVRERWLQEADGWSHNFEEYSLSALQADGTAMIVYSSPRGYIDHASYKALPGLSTCMHEGHVTFQGYAYD